MLQDIQEGFKKWAQDEYDFWYEAGRRARGTDQDYSGTSWIGYHAFFNGKES